MKRVVVPAGVELDAVLAEAEAHGDEVELVHDGRRYRLVPVAHGEDERSRREQLRARTLALRGLQAPIGVSAADLIRANRRDAYGE